jgi:hypothetical protein
MSFVRSTARTGLSPLVTILVAGVWVVLMGVLLKERYLTEAAEIRDELRFSSVEADDWFLIRLGGTYAGFGRSRQFRNGPDWRLRDDLHISLNIQGQVKPVRIRSESEVDQDFRLKSFSLKVASGLVAFQQKGSMEGKTLVLESPGSGGKAAKKLKLYEAPRISRSLGLPVPLVDLQEGQVIRIPVFDPLDGNKWDAEIKVLEKADIDIAGKKVPAWRVRAAFRTVELTMWVDGEGRLLKGRMPLGIMVMRSTKEEIAKEMTGARALPDLVSFTSVPLEGSLPESGDLSLVRLKVEGSGTWNLPSDGFRQKFRNSELTITKENSPEASYSLPFAGPNMEEHLAPTRFIRSDDAEVVKKAHEIVGIEKDPVKAARLINDWVHKNIKKVPTPAVPDAAMVLQTKQGDCNEHAVLAAALARAVGLPARIAVGLVYAGDGFYYHAWVTYWAGKTWFSGDPLMGQMPVKPSYVTLLYGDVDKHVNVVTFLGRLKLKVLEAG